MHSSDSGLNKKPERGISSPEEFRADPVRAAAYILPGQIKSAQFELIFQKISGRFQQDSGGK